VGYIALHFLVYPGQDRFMVGAYLGVLLGLVRTMRDVPPAARVPA
jgi:hypothetical protein